MSLKSFFFSLVFFAICFSFSACNRGVDCPGVKGGSGPNMMLKVDKNGEPMIRKVRKNRNGTVKK